MKISFTRGNNILDVVISSMPDQLCVNEVLKPDEAEIFSDHCVLFFELTISVKAPPKTRRCVYDYRRGDFQGLRSTLCASNLSNVITADDDGINNDWLCWKNSFQASVAIHIPREKLKGRNLLPWINGQIINLIKKETIRQKLKRSPTSDYLKTKFKDTRREVKSLIRESRDAFFGLMESELRSNPKRFWSILSHKAKVKSIPEVISLIKDNG